MTHTHISLQAILVTLAIACVAIVVSTPSILSVHANIVPTCVNEPCYSGGGLEDGVDQVTDGIGGVETSDPRQTIINIVKNVVSYMGLAAVIVLIIAGIYLIFSNGSEEAKEKAKKIIIYVIVGLLIIAFAATVVNFVDSLIDESAG